MHRCHAIRRDDAIAALQHTNNDGDAALVYAAECMEFGGPAAVAASRWVSVCCRRKSLAGFRVFLQPPVAWLSFTLPQPLP